MSQFAEDQSVLRPETIYQPIGPREPVITMIDEAHTLTDAELRQARDTVLFSPGDGEYNLQVGNADSTAEAARLQGVLGLANTGDQCVLKFYPGNSTQLTDNTILYNAVGDTGTYVKIRYYGTFDLGADGMYLFSRTDAGSDASIGALALVEVTAESVTPDAESIVFDIVCAAIPTP
jgi:hypothetical protein